MRRLPYDLRKQHDELGNAPHLMTEQMRERVFGERPDIERRTSGDTVCAVCGKLLYDHPPVVGALWLTEVCGDRIVKL
jgi:hypothetical protein